ncbi:calcium/proton exchanger [Allomyces macrogynus ATCC 38327]|uniref:Vacuolar calcium ion transporter n=1 Tax=Allomyces macrogynus (strain ATCC 38327) TaxID=578462 RepID=A0A0L0SWA1_ALLM3|nr:calcium/proton exchanger [Allomyces macrogynus ATCC 38327]|eukprot:KNE66787.1 calcium/proton exchanger [Allomyces macrogynus ATCC 38327]
MSKPTALQSNDSSAPLASASGDAAPAAASAVTASQTSLARAASDVEAGQGVVHHPEPTFMSSLMVTIKKSWLNVLLVFIILGVISDLLEWGAIPTFILNFLAIVPLASLLGFATEEIALRTNETIGGLLNATFGNAVEIIMAIIALSKGLVTVVQSTLLGSILSNLLLVTGFCFLCGGYNRFEQTFNRTAANTSTSLLGISVMSLLVPAAFVASFPSLNEEVETKLLVLSHGTAIILLIVYMLFIFFQLKTHAGLYSGEPSEEEEVPVLTLWFSIGLLLVSTILVAMCSEFLVGSIEGLTKEAGLSETFVALILLPIVGNAAEHVTAVTVAMRNKMELALGVAIGSSMQIALFVTPLLVVVGWIINQPMTLYFELFDTAVLFIAVLVVNYLIADGRSNWLEGVMLLATYLILAIAFFIHP